VQKWHEGIRVARRGWKTTKEQPDTKERYCLIRGIRRDIFILHFKRKLMQNVLPKTISKGKKIELLKPENHIIPKSDRK
jgi:hypothetical protein